MIVEKQYYKGKKLAGFWTRIMAQNIDILFPVLVYFTCWMVELTSTTTIYIGIILTILYYIVFEASPLMATPGKLAIGIVVTTKEFDRITLLQSVVRTLGKFISLSLLFIGFSMIEFNPRRKALHDYLANTQVIFKEKLQ